MNTPTHMLAGAALFGKPGDVPRTLAAILGGLVPDLPAIVMVAYALRVRGDTPQHVFGTLYFSPDWQAIMAPSHAFPVWGAALALALWFRREIATAFFASGLFHAACDFLLHHDDPHRHFWPLSDWRFASPVSYWDPAHYGNIFAPFEMALAVALIIYLFYRHRGVWLRLALGAVALVYGGQLVAFAMMFSH
jgi:membrane-bound metal-dependent hydrolase YbcI (DUF457 family)